jgi:sugar lactone lactonase YvrE
LDALVVAASPNSIRFVVPPDAEGGSMPVRIDELPGETAFLEVGRPVAAGLHQVDSPLFDREGRLYATESGERGSRPSVPLHRFALDSTRTSLAVDVGNPTSLALGPDGLVYVSSRFDGHVYRLAADDSVELFASELGVATGLAFSAAGDLYVGDRSGTIFRVTPDGHAEEFATLPSSIAAFHLAFGPEDRLYVTGPTLASHDAIYSISSDRLVDVVSERFGRPQGIAFDASGLLYVVEALAGAAGLYRLDVSKAGSEPELLLSASSLVGVALDPAGGVVLASNDTLWRLAATVKPWGPSAR